MKKLFAVSLTVLMAVLALCGIAQAEDVTPAALTLSFERTSGQPGDTVYATVTAPGATQVKVTGVWREESYYDLEDDQVVIPVILDFYDDADEEGNLLGRTFSVCALVQGEWSEEVSQKLTTVLRPDLSGTIFRNAPTTLDAGEDLVIEFLPVDGITNYYITNDSFVEEVKEPGILTIPASLFYKGGTFSFDCGAGDDYAGDLIIDWVSVEAEAYTDAEPLTISANKAETEPGKTVTFTLGGKQATRIYVQRRAMEDEDYWYDYYRNSEPVDPAAGSFEVTIDGSGDYRISALVDGKWTDWSDPVTVEAISDGPTAVLPSFTLPESLRAGEPLIMQFTERFPDDMWIHVSFYLDEDFVSEPSTMFSNGALEDDLKHVQVENGLDSGEYEIEIFAEQDGYENSDTVTCYLTVTGERPDAPSLEIVSNNAASDQRNEIRITAEELDGFILYAEYYDEDAGFDFNGPVREHEMEWTKVSDSEILVKVDRPYGSYSGVYRAAACVDGLYSSRSEESVTLTWSEEESGGDGGAEEAEAEVVDSENIEWSAVSCAYTAGEDAYNPGSVGSMTINCTVNGPSELRDLYIGTWGTAQPDEATIEEDMEFYARIWKPSYSSPGSLTFPQQFGGGMPIHEDEIGHDLYVLLIGLDKDCNANGYLVVRVSVPGTAVQGDIEFSGYTLNNLARWENNPLYLPAGEFSTYLPVFLYTEDWTNVSDASVTWVSGDENLKNMFRIVHQEGDNEMFYLNIASYNGTGTATYLLTATSETGTATKTFTVTVKEMPEEGIPRQLKDKVWIPVNETVNLSSLGIMYNPEGYEEVYYVSGDDFLVVEHDYEDVDGKRFTLKRDGTFMARETGTYSARYDILPGGNLGAMFDFEIEVGTPDGPSPQPETELPETLCANHATTLILLPVEGHEAIRTWQLFVANPGEDLWIEIDSGSGSLLDREEILLPDWRLFAEEKVRLVITVLEDGHNATVVEKEWTVEDHDYQGTVVKEATCEERGEILMTCSRCGDSWTRYTDALYHEWDEGTITVPATTTTEGEILYTCIRCRHTKTETLPVLPEILLSIEGAPSIYARPEVKVERKHFPSTVPYGVNYQWCYLTEDMDPAAVPESKWENGWGNSQYQYPIPSDPEGAETGWFYARSKAGEEWVYGKMPLSFAPLSSLPVDSTLEVKTLSGKTTFSISESVQMELHGPANSRVLLTFADVSLAKDLGSLGIAVDLFYSSEEGSWPVALIMTRDGKQYRSELLEITLTEDGSTSAPAAEYRVLSGAEIPLNGTFDVEIAPNEEISYVSVTLLDETTGEEVGWGSGVPESAVFSDLPGYETADLEGAAEPLILHVPLLGGAAGDWVTAEITTSSTKTGYQSTTVKDREDLRFVLTAAEGMGPLSIHHIMYTYLREKALPYYTARIMVECRGSETVDVEWISTPANSFSWQLEADEATPGQYYINVTPYSAGTYTMRVTVTDAAGNTKMGEYSLEVVEPIPLMLTADLPEKLLAFEGGTLHFAVSGGPAGLNVHLTIGDNEMVYYAPKSSLDIEIPAAWLKDATSVGVWALNSYGGYESNTINETIPVVQPDSRVALQITGADEGPDGLTAPAGRSITCHADAPEADWVRLHFWNDQQTQMFTKDDPHEWMWSIRVPDENAAQICYLEAGFRDEICYSEPVSITSVWYGDYTDPMSYTLTGIRNGKIFQERNLGILIPANGIPTSYILQICKADDLNDSTFWDSFDVTEEDWTGEFVTANLTAGTEYQVRITRKVEGYTEDYVLSDAFLVTEYEKPYLTASAASVKVRETVELSATAPEGQAVSICRMEGEDIAEQKDGATGETLVWPFSSETAGTYVFRPTVRDSSTGELTVWGDSVTVAVTSDGPSPQPETELPETLCADHATTLILLPVEGHEAIRTWQLFVANPGEDLWIDIDSGSGSLHNREEILLPDWRLFAEEKVRLVITVLEDGHNATVVEKEWTVEDHDYQGTVVKEATCEERGEMLMTCSRCGDSWTRYTDALYHEWDEGIITVQPTTTTEGEIQYTCVRCGKTKTETVPSDGPTTQPAAVLPSFTLPESLRAGEPLVLQFGGTFDENIWVNVNLYRDDEFVEGSSFCSSALEEDYTEILVNNGLDSGKYQVEAYAERAGYENSNVVTYILTVTGERPAVPTLEIVKNGANSNQANEIRITGESIDSFILYVNYYDELNEFWFNGPVTESEMTWTQVSDSEILVQVSKPYGITSAEYSAAAGVGGFYSRRSEQTVTLNWQQTVLYAPTQNITWQNSYQIGEPIIVTLERVPDEDERIGFNFYKAENGNYIDYVMVDANSNLDDDLNVTLYADGLPAGSYDLGVCFLKDNYEYTLVYHPLAFTVGEAITDEKIMISVSDEELYTGNEVTVTASNPEAEGIRIYRKRQYNEAEIVDESEDTSCEYAIIYNHATTLEFWAEACYDGEWSGVYSERKTVRFISHGQLGVPTFECGTQFNPGEAITVTRTNHVSNEETCLLFLSTPDHSQTIINGLSFAGEDTLTISAPEEPGEYILSVLVMAPGWDNNQTDITIYVTGGDGGAEEAEAEIVDSENIEWSAVSCAYTAGEDAYNPGSVGSMTINCTVNGPSELRALYIGTWGTAQPDEATIEEDMEFYARIWKPHYSSPGSLTFPQQLGGGMPIHEDEIGKDLYVLLIGLDKDCNAIGYLVVRVSVPGTAVQGDIEFSEYTLINLARWENNPLYLPAGGFSTYLPVFLYTEDWTNVSDASVTWVSGDENLKNMFRIVHQEGDNEMFYLNIASYNGTGTATYLLTATAETGTATKTFTVTVKEMPEDGIPRQLKDMVRIPVNETVNLSSLGIMYNPEGYEEVYYVSGDDFLVVEHEYEDVDGKRFTLKRDGTFMAREAGTYSARYDILPGGNLGAMFDYEIVAEDCLKIPEGIERIESEAFRNIGASIIQIPESVQSIADDAFDSDVTLVLEKGSKWENWAAEKEYQVCVTE